MTKYIDADRLKEAVEKKYNSNDTVGDRWDLGYDTACEQILDIIDSLQQEQPVIQNGKFVFPKYLYARTKDNKTIDMSYVPQDITAIEYIRNDFVEQEQQEVDLEKEIKLYFDGWTNSPDYFQAINAEGECVSTDEIIEIARHFYELGVNARKA